MNKQLDPIQMIPINQIHILNPRVRSPKLFEGVVQNIAKVGLKRPITVTRRKAKADGKTYDLVCGQGRLEAFMACAQTTIPAIVIAASEEQALIMSLVENVARRKHRPMDLLQGVELLRGQGYDAKDIATKTGHTADYIQGILMLLEHGEERLVSAVEAGQIPIMLAIDIVQSPKNEQQPLREAYETGELSGHKFMAAKRLVEARQRSGKTFRSGSRGSSGKRDEGYTARELVKTYKREVERKSLITRRAEAVNSQLMFVVEALHCLKQEGYFTTLLRAEGLDTMTTVTPMTLIPSSQKKEMEFIIRRRNVPRPLDDALRKVGLKASPPSLPSPWVATRCIGSAAPVKFGVTAWLSSPTGGISA